MLASLEKIRVKTIRNRPARFLLTAVACLMAVPFLMGDAALAQPPGGQGPTSPKYSKSERAAPDRLIVKFKSGAQASAVDMALARARVRVRRRMRFAGASVLEVLEKGERIEEVIQFLEESELVEYAEPDFIIDLDSTFPNDPDFPELWGLHNTGQEGGNPDADIDAPEAWDFATGSSDVVVAVIDTGVDYTHRELSPSMWRNPREVANGLDDDGNGYVDDIFGVNTISGSGDPYDDHSHGTHVAGTIGAKGNNRTGVVGVNWDSSIMALKFLSASGSGYTSDAIECIDYAVRMKMEHGVDVRVINASWGGGGYSQALKDAIQAAGEAGILFVAAAGNSSLNTDAFPYFPSSYDLPSVVSIAATDRWDNLTAFSNYGVASVDFGAPGVDIFSTTPGGSYGRKSGTSMAAPHVSGAAALVWDLHPSSDPVGMKRLLCDMADEIPALRGNTACEGRLNVSSALQSCEIGEAAIQIAPLEGFAVPTYLDTVVTTSLSQCASSIIGATVVVTPDNGDESLLAHDDGVTPDLYANDGTYSASWTPGNAGPVTLVVDAIFNGGSVTDRVSGDVFDVPHYAAYDDVFPFNWIDAAQGQNAGITGDDTFVEIPIGFDFAFYGESYDTVYISSNGFLTFGTDNAWEYINAPIPSYQAPNGLIAPYWNDLNPAQAGAVYYLLQGEAPLRKLTVEWRDVPYFGEASTATFEVTLFESLDWIVFQYLNVGSNSSAHDFGQSATVGIEDATGFSGVQYSYNEPAIHDSTVIWLREAPKCDDGRDNDDDELVDYPDDPQCWSELDDSERRCGLLGIEILTLAPIAWAMRLRRRLRLLTTPSSTL